jgi:hypothetical protein
VIMGDCHGGAAKTLMRLIPASRDEKSGLLVDFESDSQRTFDLIPIL